MSYLVCICERKFGDVQFLQKDETVVKSLNDECYMEHFHEAETKHRKIKYIYEKPRASGLVYIVKVVNIKLLISLLSEKRLKNYIFSLDESDLVC